MSPFYENLVVSLLGAIVGAGLQFLVPYVSQRRQSRRRNDLVGRWKSCYVHENSGTWVTDDVEVEIKGARFLIRTSNTRGADPYEGEAVLSGGELVGTWESKIGTVSGNLLLAVDQHGAVLYGYYSGAKSTGERVFAPWVFGRVEADLTVGKELLRQQSLALGSPSEPGTSSTAGQKAP